MNAVPRASLLRLLAVASVCGLSACADVDSPFRVAERGSQAWSIGWIIAGILVGATVAAGVVKLRVELAKKKAAAPTASGAPRERRPLPGVWLGMLFAGVLLFTGAIVLLVATFLARAVSLTEVGVGGGIMAVGTALMWIAGRRISADPPPPEGQP